MSKPTDTMVTPRIDLGPLRISDADEMVEPRIRP
jgi:hypothetical protein